MTPRMFKHRSYKLDTVSGIVEYRPDIFITEVYRSREAKRCGVCGRKIKPMEAFVYRWVHRTGSRPACIPHGKIR